MAASSGLVIARHRQRLVALWAGAEARIRREWPDVFSGLLRSWPDDTAGWLTEYQRTAVRTSSAFLSAFLTTELGKQALGPTLQPDEWAGKFPDGRDLSEALMSPFVGTLGSRKDGASEARALQIGLDRALKMTEAAIAWAARDSQHQGMERDERITGWRRSISGTCGGCIGDATATSLPPGTPMRYHPNCKCVAAPDVRGARDAYRPLTGSQVWDRLTPEQREASVGKDTARKVHEGEITLESLRLLDEIETPAGRPDNIILRQGPADRSDH